MLKAFEDLDVPLYLHPATAPAAIAEVLFGGLAPAVAARLATNAWGWHAEAGLHALRMIAAGTFERHPRLRLIIGHCGEMLPFMLARIDEMLPPQATGLPHPPSTYVHSNVWVTTSGMFSLPPVLCAIQVMGVDRVLFSVDYPFAANMAGRELLDALPVSPADKAKIAGGNAEHLLRLPEKVRLCGRPGNPQSEGSELVERVVVAALDVVHPVQHRRPVSHGRGEHRRESCTHIR
jgi:predicted TIM-barrel fold metal-dependent hydrolase